MLYDEAHIAPTHHPVGIVVKSGTELLIDIRNPLLPGQTIEYLDRGLASSFHKIDRIVDAEGVNLEKANPGNLVRLITDPPSDNWLAGSLLRKEV